MRDGDGFDLDSDRWRFAVLQLRRWGDGDCTCAVGENPYFCSLRKRKRDTTVSGELILFVLIAILAIGSAVATITRRNPVAAALFLVLHFASLAALYLFLSAQVLAVLQILVYAGAIMVLILFVIMLLNLGKEEQLAERFQPRAIFALIFGGLLLLFLVVALTAVPIAYPEMAAKAAEIGTIGALARELFTTYLFPFEAVSLLLLVAVVGAIVLAKKKLEIPGASVETKVIQKREEQVVG